MFKNKQFFSWLEVMSAMMNSKFEFILGGKRRYRLADRGDPYTFFGLKTEAMIAFLESLGFTKMGDTMYGYAPCQPMDIPITVILANVDEYYIIDDIHEYIISARAEETAVHPEHGEAIWNMAKTITRLHRCSQPG